MGRFPFRHPLRFNGHDPPRHCPQPNSTAATLPTACLDLAAGEVDFQMTAEMAICIRKKKNRCRGIMTMRILRATTTCSPEVPTTQTSLLLNNNSKVETTMTPESYHRKKFKELSSHKIWCRGQRHRTTMKRKKPAREAVSSENSWLEPDKVLQRCYQS